VKTIKKVKGLALILKHWWVIPPFWSNFWWKYMVSRVRGFELGVQCTWFRENVVPGFESAGNIVPRVLGYSFHCQWTTNGSGIPRWFN